MNQHWSYVTCTIQKLFYDTYSVLYIQNTNEQKGKGKLFLVLLNCAENIEEEVTRISLQTHLEEKCICGLKMHKLKLVLIL